MGSPIRNFVVPDLETRTVRVLTLCILETPIKTGALANSEDPDEMPHNTAFHQSPMFAKTKSIFRERNTIWGEIITCDPSKYTMDHPDLTVSIRFKLNRKFH